MGTSKLQHCISLYLFYFLFSSRAYANCYWPNGTDRNLLLLQGDVYQPCDGGDKFSMCCATNRTPADKCRSDGLCQSTFDNNVWRDSCTDPYWKSPKCIKLCDHGIGDYQGKNINLSGSDATVTPCEDGSYCCGNGTLAEKCCNDKKGVFVIDGVTTNVSPLSTSKAASSIGSVSRSPSNSVSSTTPSSNISPNPASSPSSATITVLTSSSAKPSSSNHVGAIVGGVIGGIAVVALSILAGLLLQRRRTRSRARTHSSRPWSSGDKSQIIYEAPPNARRTELDAREVKELDEQRIHYEMQ